MSTTIIASNDGERPRLLTKADIADLLQFSVRTVCRMDEREQIPEPLTIGRNKRWPEPLILRWIDQGCPSRKNFEM